jgi:carboxynorspermidine decarboxylase
LAGATCLAGDVIGDYSFAEPLAVGSKLAFLDMAHYTMVKNNTFNGIRLPTIAIHDSDGDELTIVREFQYEDFRNRLS